ncbi:MAG: ATP-binding protein [Polyangiaceae bacterium]
MSDGQATHRPRRIVLTGGPGAGKTAILEIIRKAFCEHVAIVPESASILFRGGFPRESSDAAECGAQRAIFHVQIELERLYELGKGIDLVLCDRGTVDSVAYWPHPAEEFWRELGTTGREQLARYDVVIHLEPPADGHGYHRDVVRTESAAEAAAIDARIVAAWKAHPRRYSVPSTPRFLEKVKLVMAIVERELRCECSRTATAAG